MYLYQGFPSIESYNKLLESSLFLSMELFSNQFLAQNKSALKIYSKKWVPDPFHQWSRQYEYPFVYYYVLDYINNRQKSDIKILDAGSGMTFFPYYLASIAPNIQIFCCDYDTSHGKIFPK